MARLYPLKFSPQLKTVIWGGKKIAPFKGLDTDQEKIGESWELSGVRGHESVVSNGPLTGRDITSLAAEYKGALLGRHVYEAEGGIIPLLIKFIDARQDLSIQVHPNDELAAERHGSKGKTEMWFVIQADPEASIYSGFSKNISPEEYEKRVTDGTLTEVLAHHEVKSGDVFFLPAGRIHAICSGCFLAEIQETSDITYRIFDYNRPGLDGKPRELHTTLAKDAIDFTYYSDLRTPWTEEIDKENPIVDCDLFTVNEYTLSKPFFRRIKDVDSFIAVICIAGEGFIETSSSEVIIHPGETILVPACEDIVTFKPRGNEHLKLLTSYVK